MKSKFAIIVLIVFCAALGITLNVRSKKANEEKQGHVAHITKLSNDVTQTQMKLNEQKDVNLSLEQNVAALRTEVANISNKFISTSADLARTQAEAKAAAEAAAAEMAKRDARIAELEGQNDDMTKQMVDLNDALTKLERQIADTEQKLAASEGDREFLLAELKRLQAEKAELEKQFNDLAILREQVRKLKEELSIARRLEWIRRGIYGAQTAKGGERMIQPNWTFAATNVVDADLNVELNQDGSVKVERPADANR